MWSGLLSRVVVAIVALPGVIALVYLGGWWIAILALAVAFLALHEYAEMIRPLRPLVLACYVGALAVVLGAELGGLVWMVAGSLSTLAVVFVLQGLAGTRQAATAIASTVLGTGWIAIGLGFVLLIRDIPDNGRLAIFTVLLCIYAADTVAYFAGRLFGRHKLSPVISPGKTWEGFVAGTAAAVAVAFFALYDQGFLAGWESLVLGAAIALSGVAGDLFVSVIKRDMQVKDTGRLLAAHGGVLDRIDSLLFAAPAAFYVIVAVS
jgi:phosphatidate cytidylyltransferase